MKFEKKLIILSGENDAKGTLTLEHNAYGTFATFNIYNLKNLEHGEYVVGLKDSERVFTRKVGLMGRIVSRFEIDEINLDKVHCVIYDTLDEKPVMYGTNDTKRLWHGNMMDGLKSKKLEFPKVSDKEEIEASLPVYSKRTDNIENYFLDILPKNDANYIDTAVAAVNYYPDKMNIEVKYSKRDDAAVDFTNPVDRAEKNLSQQEQKIAVQSSQDCENNSNRIEPDEGRDIDFGAGEPLNEDNIKEQINETADKYECKKETDKKQSETDGSPFYNNAENIVSTSQVDEHQKLFDNKILKDKLFKKEQITPSGQADGESSYKDSGQGIKNIAAKAKNVSTDVRFKDTAAKTGNGIKDTFNKADNESLEAALAQKTIKINTANEPSASSESAATVPPLESRAYVGQQNMEFVFYEQIKGQLDDLFTSNPKFETLEKLLPETKWTKVDYDNSGKYYVVGLIGAKPDYVCYGVPATYTPDAPSELSGYCQWLPLDETKPTGEGFWLMFQDATSGESIKQTEGEV